MFSRRRAPWAPALQGSLQISLKRESLDLGLLVRRVLGVRVPPTLLRLLPRGRFSLVKEHIVHAVILLIVGGVVLTNYVTEAADHGSILFRLFGEAAIEEGPLDTKALRQRASASVGGGNVAFAQADLAGGVAEDDIEFEIANTFGGNAIIATNVPETSVTPDQKRSGIFAYTVKEGDTTSTIAARFGVSTKTIEWANGLAEDDVIRTGDILVVLPVTGVRHTVRDGDTVASIAKRYDAKAEDILAQNGLGNGDIREGQKLIVPDGYIAPTPTPERVVADAPDEKPSPEEKQLPPPPSKHATPGGGLLWPTEGHNITQYYRWGHTGVDIANRALPPVYASHSGRVAFSGWLGGYGRMVAIHDSATGITTRYAHLSASYVKAGQEISKGETIGKVGSTGRSTGPHLHYEILRNGVTQNPLSYY